MDLRLRIVRAVERGSSIRAAARPSRSLRQLSQPLRLWFHVK
jgi:hypothetical protein